MDGLDDLTAQLEATAAQLRAPGLAPERAAALVEEAARLAASASAELDRRARAAEQAPAPDQLTLEP
jgi:hypothetical protein